MKTFKQAEGEEDMMTVLANIDNRMPLDESHLDPHIEVGSRKRCLRRKLFIYLCTVPLFSATIPWLLQQHQVDLKLSRVSEASVGVQIRHGSWQP